ncbi:MAG: hypothetical protein DLM50_05360 [Candidatus Meridianibacter frigidus]|nr:MAG: hypothetical protein DLM50_05360 [Candidatus Eremiobacteraeota bacterium]
MKIRLLAVAAVACAAIFVGTQPAGAQNTPAPAPTATPTVQIPPALPPLIKHEYYAEGGYLVPAIVCNELATPCAHGDRYRSATARAAIEFPVAGNGITAMLKVDYRRYVYQHQAGFINLAGGGTAFSPVFQAREQDFDIRAGVRALEPRLYLGLSYLRETNNYGYPSMRGYGLGLEKLPDVDQTFSVYGSAYYYPRVDGTYTQPIGPNAGVPLHFAYHRFRYDFGVTLKPSSKSPVFIDMGYLGDHTRTADNAPANVIRAGPFVGIGIGM